MNQIITKILLLFIAFIMLSCSQEKPNERPNVLLIIADNLRIELNCYGADYIHSPNRQKSKVMDLYKKRRGRRRLHL